MKNGSCSATTVAGSAALAFVISTGGVMGLRPTQGDEKRVLFSNHTQWKRRPPLCHLDRSSEGGEWRDLRFQRSFPGNVFRPEESWAKGLPKVMKNGFCSATTLNGSAAFPFVISTGVVMGLRPTQGDEKRVLFGNHTQWKRRPPRGHRHRRSHGPLA